MAGPALTPESQFTVGEEKWLNYILSILFLALALYPLAGLFIHGFRNPDYQGLVLVLAIIPAWIFFRKARSRRVFLRVNKSGIYQDEKLLTGWKGFIRAYLDQQQKTVTIRDNFVLVVEYKKEDLNKVYKRVIALTNTQNQSEEDIMAAIRFFLALYRQGHSQDPPVIRY